MEKITFRRINCDFPVVRLRDVNVRYSKVRKVSGIEFILLTLIKRYPQDTKLVKALEDINIDAALLSLFSDALFSLAGRSDNKGVLVCREADSAKDMYEFRGQFDSLTLKDIKLTQEGEELFQKQYVYTGKESSKRLDMYFDLVHGRFFEIGVHPKIVDNPVNTPDLYSESLRIEQLNRAHLVDFLNTQKRGVGIQNEETITDAESFDPQIDFVKYPIDIAIGDEGAEFTCEDSEYLEFLTNDKNATSTLSGSLRNKKSVTWGDGVNHLKLKDVRDAEKLITPEEIASFEKQSFLFVIGDVDLGLHLSPKFKEFKVPISKTSVVVVDDKGSVKSLSPATVDVDYVGIKGAPFSFDVLVVRPLSEKDSSGLFQKLSSPLSNLLGKEERADEKKRLVEALCWLCGKTGDDSAIVSFTQKSVFESSKDIRAQIDAFFAQYKYLSTTDFGVAVCKKTASRLLEKCVDDATLDNLEFRSCDARKLSEVTGFSHVDILSRFADKLSNGCSEIELFDKFISAGYDEKDVMTVANIVECYVSLLLSGKNITGDSQCAEAFKAFEHNFKELKDIVGIENDPIAYTPKEITDVNFFRTQMGFFVKKFKQLKSNYESYARQKFNELQKFYDEIVRRNTELQDNGVTNWTEDDFFQLADVKQDDCIQKWQTRAELELKKALNTPSDSKSVFWDNLGEAKKKGVLTNRDYNIFNVLRKARNARTHRNNTESDGDIKPVKMRDLHEGIEALFRLIEYNEKNASSERLGNHADAKFNDVSGDGFASITTSGDWDEMKIKELAQKEPKVCALQLTKRLEVELRRVMKLVDRTKQLQVMLNDAKMKSILSPEAVACLKELCKLASQDQRLLKNESFSGVNFDECIKAISDLVSRPIE